MTFTDITSLKTHLEGELCRDDNRFMLTAVRDYIQSCDTYETVVVGCVTAYYVYPKKEVTKIPSNFFIRKVMSRVNRLLDIFKIEKTLTYFILPIRTPRRFPRNGEVCKAKHINGAYTYRNSGKVYLFRCEEMAKVAVHEACHHLMIHTEHWSISGNHRLYTTFGIDPACTLLANEAVIEFWAEIFHCLFLSSEHHVPVEVLVEKEVSHALQKAKKLLAYKQKHFGDNWREETNAFAYIVLRAVLLYHHTEFTSMFPAFRNEPYDTNAITDFLIRKYQDSGFERAMKHAVVPRKNDMRMTVFGDL